MILAPHIAAHIFNVPLMVEPGKLQAFLIGLGARLVEGGIRLPGVVAVDHVAFSQGRPSDSMGRIGNPLGRSYEKAGHGDDLLDRIDGIGVIPIEGTLVHKGKFIGQSSGETSYEGVQAQVARATADPSIRGVVFEVDSFGGEVAGAFETAKMIAALSDKKPTLAILTDFAMSAGYLMASAARQIVMPETGGAGSIGVVTVHTDMSRSLENDGVKVTLLSSGAHKVDGHPFGPLADDVRSSIQARLDRSREIFAEAVGAFRGRRLSKDAALATEAQTYFGSDAVKAGLVDGIIDPSQAFTEFHRKVN